MNEWQHVVRKNFLLHTAKHCSNVRQIKENTLAHTDKIRIFHITAQKKGQCKLSHCELLELSHKAASPLRLPRILLTGM